MRHPDCVECGCAQKAAGMSECAGECEMNRFASFAHPAKPPRLRLWCSNCREPRVWPLTVEMWKTTCAERCPGCGGEVTMAQDITGLGDNLPCPFCGGKAHQPNPAAPQGGMRRCMGCGAQAWGSKWNRRFPSEDWRQGWVDGMSEAAELLTPDDTRNWDGWDEWEAELTDFLSTLAIRTDEIGKRAEALGSFMPDLRAAFARHADVSGVQGVPPVLMPPEWLTS